MEECSLCKNQKEKVTYIRLFQILIEKVMISFGFCFNDYLREMFREFCLTLSLKDFLYSLPPCPHLSNAILLIIIL